MIGKLLCSLGLHQPIVTKPSVPIKVDCGGGDYVDYGQWTSAIGFCARDGCTKTYQWDG